MPQLDYTTFASQLFWLLITFSVLYIALANIALPAIRDVLQARQDRISHDLEKAEIARREAEQAKQEYTEALEKARRNAADALASVTANLKKESSRQHAELDAVLAAQALEAEKRIAALQDEAQTQLLPLSVKVAESIAQKLLGTEFDTKTIAAVIAKENQGRI